MQFQYAGRAGAGQGRRESAAVSQALKRRGYQVVTRIEDARSNPFWPSEACHQVDYQPKGTEPTCCARVRRFGD